MGLMALMSSQNVLRNDYDSDRQPEIETLQGRQTGNIYSDTSGTATNNLEMPMTKSALWTTKS